MKFLLIFSLVLLVAFVSCTTTNSPVTNTYVVDSFFVRDSLAPKITSFSPDTVWTFGTLKIYGSHFGYNGGVRVTIDTTEEVVTANVDTMITAYVQESTPTGIIHVSTVNGSSVSTKPVVVEQTFTPHAINDTLPIGASFSILGTGMNHYHGFLHLSVQGVPFPIDSVFPDRIVSHIVPSAVSGDVSIADSLGPYNNYLGTLTVTLPSAWNILSIIWDNVTVIETHQRIGYINGPANPIDSIWKDTVLYSGQRDDTVTGIPFIVTLQDLDYKLSSPNLDVYWYPVSQAAYIYYRPESFSQSETHSIDTTWSAVSSGLPAPLPVTNDIEFAMPTYGYRITEDSTDLRGLVNWQETTTTAFLSGRFDLVFKH